MLSEDDRNLGDAEMADDYLSEQDIRSLNRDLQILIATNGTLTRILAILSNDEIELEIVRQEVERASPPTQMPSYDDVSIPRFLRRRVLLRSRLSGVPLVAAESLIATDDLPPIVATSFTDGDHPIGEIMLATGLEVFKEEPTVWKGSLPDWVRCTGRETANSAVIARRYRVRAGGKPVITITEHFLQEVF